MSVHLFVRSCYSLLDSTIRIPKLIEKAKKEGMKHICLSDHLVMYGTAAFLRACKDAGLHGIVGLEADVEFHNKVVPFLLLAKDNIGYQNLMKLSSYYGEGHKNAPIDFFLKCAKHNVVIAFGEGGYCDEELVKDDREGLIAKIKQMKEELPPFDFALSYQETSLWKMRNETLKRVCNSLRIPTVALNKIYYLEQDEAEDYRCLSGIRTNKNRNDKTLPILQGRYFRSEAEMHSLYAKEDLQRTEEIAKECQGDYLLEKTELPLYQNKMGAPSDVYLKALCYAGLKRRLNGVPNKAYEDRLNYELNIIFKMHFENYFLIVYDFILAARKKNIYVGPGRGSAAGSLVAYTLGITQVDPMQYHLLFERFLNPERVSMPDIDTDVSDIRRREVLQYVYDQYGSEHVADIVAFGTLAARQVLHDVGKYLNMSQRDVDTVLKLIPRGSNVSLADVYNENSRLRQLIASDGKYQLLYKYALHLEGLPRHSSVHAAGVLLSQKPLCEIIPTTHEDMFLTCQYSAEYLEERGLIKMDILASKNLSTIDEVVQNIKKTDPDFDIFHIPFNDAKTYAIFQRGDTAGIFQFESDGMRSLLRRMKPTCFEDIVATLALFRPASKESIPTYIDGKNGKTITYPVRELEPILKETYGVMLYQEQAMLTAEICAGFTLGRADVLRKAMSKKKVEEVEKLKEEFIKGCLLKNYSQETAEKLFELVSRFGGYGFNKSHAVAYGQVVYQMTYLKANYPEFFYNALFNSAIGDGKKTSLYIEEARHRNLKIKNPDANISESVYVSQGNVLYLPFSQIKGIGKLVSDTIVKERKKNGPYLDFFDFVARILLHRVSKSNIESMIDAGVCDCFGYNRKTFKVGLEDALRFGQLVQIGHGDEITLDLNLVTKPDLVNQKEEEMEKIHFEREALGFCLGKQPIVLIRETNHIQEPRLAEILEKIGLVHGFAQIESVYPHRTKKGDMMAFLKISDETAITDLTVMPRLYEKVSNILVRGAYIRFHAKISQNDSMLAEDISRIQRKE